MSKIDSLVEDTFFEAFEGKYVRALITADFEETVRKAAFDSTATPGTVIGRLEGGVESFLSPDETPNGKYGAIVQFWYNTEDIEKFELELSYRIRQDILVKPFTSVYDYTENPDGYISTLKQVGNCGDGFEWEEKLFNRDMIVVPIAVPDFKIESNLGYSTGIMGANFWYMCKDKETVIEAGNTALEAIDSVEGTIHPFDICSAASKPETNFPWIGPSTNHPYCPSLKDRLKGESKVPEGVNYIPEIVINGVSLDAVNEATKLAIEAILDFDGIIKISSGNYDGNLGDFKVNLFDILK